MIPYESLQRQLSLNPYQMEAYSYSCLKAFTVFNDLTVLFALIVPTVLIVFSDLIVLIAPVALTVLSVIIILIAPIVPIGLDYWYQHVTHT